MDKSTLNTIRTLRSIHDNFNEKDISKEDMDTIIDMSMKAANASNLQRYSMILLDDKKLIYEITGKKTANKAIVYCLDYNRLLQTASFTGHMYHAGVDNWYDILSGVFDVSALAQTAVIAAKAIGIDSLITNGVLRQDQRKVKELLKLPPKYCIAVMAVLFGYHDKHDMELHNRLSKEFIVHYNQYQSLNDDQYERIVSESDEINPDFKDDRYPHYLDWFFEEWCKPRHKKESEDLRQMMLEAGFHS